MSTNAQFQTLGPFFDGGVLQSGVKLYHYEAGSVGFSSPKDIWQDRSKSIVLANPYQGDARGLLSFFGDGLYKLIVAKSTSTGPSHDVLYTWDNFSILDTIQSVFEEGDAVTAASTITVGPGIWTHIIGSAPISQITGDPPFQWLAFDVDQTMTHSANLVLPNAKPRTFKTGDVAFFLNDGNNVWRLAMHHQGAEGAYDGRIGSTYPALATLTIPADGDFVDIGGSDVDVTALASMPAGYHFHARFTGSGVQLIHSATLICPNGDDYRLCTNEIVEFRSLSPGTWLVAFRSGPTAAPADFKGKLSTTADDGFLLPVGTATIASRYRALAKKCIPLAGTFGTTGTSLVTSTFDNATEIWTSVTHGLVDGDIVQLTNSGGALPSGFAGATVYYVISATPTTFKLSLTRGGAAVDGTTNGTGTHTVHNKFQLPDVRGRALIALDNLGGSAASLVTGATALGYTVGAQNHTLTFEQIPGDNVHAAATAAAGKHALTDTPPAAAPHNNMQPSFAVGVQIRW